MKKQILSLLLAAVTCLVAVCPFSVCAAALDPDADASLTLHYQANGKAFPDLSIGIFRVAEALPDGTFQLIAPFSSYPVNIHDITQQSQWKTIATTLDSCCVADRVLPDREAQTDAEGTARFSDVKTGLYLVREVIAENTDGVYIFNTFMVYVPTPQPDGTYAYQVEAKPKCASYVPKNRYTVTKLWQDEGNQASRPKEVTVDIYKDGVLTQTQLLHAGNNWSYTWQVAEETPGKWTVAERVVPDTYKVTIRQNGHVFTIINSTQTTPEKPPQTGDTFTPLPWVIAICLSGVTLLLLGFYNRRGK